MQCTFIARYVRALVQDALAGNEHQAVLGYSRPKAALLFIKDRGAYLMSSRVEPTSVAPILWALEAGPSVLLAGDDFVEQIDITGTFGNKLAHMRDDQVFRVRWNEAGAEIEYSIEPAPGSCHGMTVHFRDRGKVGNGQ